MSQLTASTATSIPAPAPADGLLARIRNSHWLPLPVLLTGTCLIVLDFFIVNVAMPSMQRDLHAGASTIEWVVAGYGLTFAVFLLAAGRLGDRFGRRRMFSTGIGLFTAASLACGPAPTPAALVIARLGQGVAGAMIAPTVLAFIGILYDGADRARAIGLYATVMGVAAAGGQLIGGVLLHLDVAGLGWRTVFLINVPIGIAALALVKSCLPDGAGSGRARVDVVGLMLATAALTALVFPLIDGRAHGWPLWSYVSLAASPLLGADFLWWQRRLVRRGVVPTVDPSWFRERSFGVGLLTQLGFWTGQASYFLVLALYLQFGRGLSALESGLVFSILALAYLIASIEAPVLVRRFGRSVIVAGAVSLAAGHVAVLLAVMDGHGSTLAMTPGLLLAGAGMGLCLAPITTIVLTRVEPTRAGVVGGLLSTTQQVGNAIGVAVIGVVFFNGLAHGYAHAFELSTAVLAALLVAVAASARSLPTR
jgi:EmrB/QacA subfamily drug resistance transporter